MTLHAPARLGAYIEALKLRTETISRQIDKEQKRPMPDWQKLRTLKSIRVRVNDAMEMARSTRKKLQQRALKQQQFRSEI